VFTMFILDLLNNLQMHLPVGSTMMNPSHQKSMERKLEVFSGGQLFPTCSYLPTATCSLCDTLSFLINTEVVINLNHLAAVFCFSLQLCFTSSAAVILCLLTLLRNK